MKHLVYFFSLLVVLCLTTSTHSTPVVKACRYFKITKSDDEAAFLNIFASLFNKLKAGVPLNQKECRSLLNFMHNLASNFRGDAKKHASALINYLKTHLKLPPPSDAASSPSHTSSTASPTTSPHLTNAPLAQPAAKEVHPKVAPPRSAAAPVRKQTTSNPRKTSQNPHAPARAWKDHNTQSTAATNKTELQTALDLLERHKKLSQAQDALSFWKDFNKHLQEKQKDLATQLIQRMSRREAAITKLLEEETFSDETPNPELEHLYKIRQSIQRLRQEMHRRLELKEAKPALRTQRNSAPRLRVEIPSPSSLSASPHGTKKRGSSNVPKLALANARTPKSILKKASHRSAMPSGMSRASYKTHFTSEDPDVRLVTARFSYDTYWSDYLNNTETYPYRAPRFKKDSQGKWNQDAIVPLRSIIGSPEGNFSEGLSFKDAESCHCWIQWAFPTMHRSDYNPYALTSNDRVLEELRAKPELCEALVCALRYFLAFMGLKYINNSTDRLWAKPTRITFKQADDYNTRMKNIIAHPHNFKRITRVIESLKVHFLSNHSTAFCSYLTNTLPELDENFKKASQRSKRYWINAANVHRKP